MSTKICADGLELIPIQIISYIDTSKTRKISRNCKQ